MCRTCAGSQAQPARGNDGDGALGLGFEELFGHRIEEREVEIAVQAVEGEGQGLLALGSEKGDGVGVEDALARPELDSSVADIADERAPLVEGLADGLPGENYRGLYPPLNCRRKRRGPG